MGPDEFIPIAEQSGLMLPIGEWILREALGQLASWRAHGQIDDETRMAVNLSTVQLNQADIVERVAAAIDTTGVPAGLVHIEITETTLIDRIESAVEALVALRNLGVKICIDDFGTGFSSLSYVDRLPIDILKIDRSFVSALGVDKDDSIVRVIVALADSLGFDVIAEGVETSEQLEVLQCLGIGFGQGYFWSRPKLPADVQAWCAANSAT